MFDVSADVILNSYATNEGGRFALNDPQSDLLDAIDTLLFGQLINDPASTNIFNPSGENTVSVSGLDILLISGTAYTFDINVTGAGVQGFVTSFDNSAVSPSVPAPATFALMLSFFGVVALRARRARH